MADLNKIAQEGRLFDGRYRLLRPLSHDGGTADVWLALDTNTIDEVYSEDADQVVAQEESGILVAIKIYRPKNALDMGEQRFRDEFKIVFNCHHTNLVQPINFSIFEGVPYLVLPYCKEGSSEKFVGKMHNKAELWRYIEDVSAGLEYLHSFNPTIVHHDIKPANVLIDDNGHYAITDFGISSHRGNNRDGYDEPISGTMAYMAPERFNDNYQSMQESDIWSFGTTLYELITGKIPFGEDGGYNQHAQKSQPPEIKENVPKDIKRLIKDCMAEDPKKRPSAAAIHRAAKARQYPIRNWMKYSVIGVIALTAILFLIFIPLKKEQENANTPQSTDIPPEQAYNDALALVNSDIPDNIKQGIAILDSLSDAKFVPAIYELAYTYGWYSDPESLHRKTLLGIDYWNYQGDYESIGDKQYTDKYMAKDPNINYRALSYLQKITELNDSSYSDYNAQALYRLAVYYLNENRFTVRNRTQAEKLLKQAKEWNKMKNDTLLQQRIDKGLTNLKK